MTLWPFGRPAVAPQPHASERLEKLEGALAELRDRLEAMEDENESVIEKVRSWSAREAARRRHEANRNLEAMEAGAGVSDGEEGGAPSPGPATIIEQLAQQRAMRKAAVARRFSGGR